MEHMGIWRPFGSFTTMFMSKENPKSCVIAYALAQSVPYLLRKEKKKKTSPKILDPLPLFICDIKLNFVK